MKVHLQIPLYLKQQFLKTELRITLHKRSAIAKVTEFRLRSTFWNQRKAIALIL